MPMASPVLMNRLFSKIVLPAEDEIAIIQGSKK
jgi:hypothetical protein